MKFRDMYSTVPKRVAPWIGYEVHYIRLRKLEAGPYSAFRSGFGIRGRRDGALEDGTMAQAFKTGDMVQLKSGGPRMTLTSLDDRGYVRTAWFVGAEKEHGHFHLDALIGASAEPPKRPTIR
jgi:uncharacterized protein YodC (DUF2158 family)